MSGGMLKVVTIDGPAGSGKSTMAKALAARLGWRKLDTGAIYRSLALYADGKGVSWTDEAALAQLAAALPLSFRGDKVLLDGRDVSALIREPRMSEGASVVSAHRAVRAALLKVQRAVAEQEPCVAEGRDTGTVVFPNALVKFFLSASLEERARRRWKELLSHGQSVSIEEVTRAEEERDRRDSTRAVAPLAKADDAVEIDSTHLSIEEVLSLMERHVRQRLAEAGD